MTTTHAKAHTQHAHAAHHSHARHLPHVNGHSNGCKDEAAKEVKELEAEKVHQGSVNARMAVKENDNVLLNNIAVTITEQLNILKHSPDPVVAKSISVLNQLVTEIDKYCGMPA